MDKDTALDLALEELENCADLLKVFEAPLDSCVGAAMLGAEKAITAIKQARALDKKAENARELGLDYEPADGTQVSKVWWDGEKLMAKPIPLEDIYLPAPECTRSHPHENMDAMCELRTEIARLTNENARLKAIAVPVQEPVAKDSRDCPYCYHVGSVHCGDVKDKILSNGGDLGYCSNAQIYGRRTQPQPQPQQEPVAWMTQARNFVHVMEFTEAEAKLYGWMPVYTTPPAAQRQWTGLTDEEQSLLWEISRAALPRYATFYRLIEAKLKEKNND